MKILITGSRNFDNYEFMKSVLNDFDSIEEIIHGGCKGADKYASRYAKKYGYAEKVFSAEWNKYGHGAGPIRNAQMVNYCKKYSKSHLICMAFPSFSSKGTYDMLNKVRKELCCPIFVYNEDIWGIFH